MLVFDRSRRWRGLFAAGRRVLWLAATVLFFGSATESATARSSEELRRQRGAPEAIALGALPSEAQATYRAIRAGGPFRYPKDGVVFGNRERRLPAEPRGYYHEYTVPTPGSRDRGARRIVCGGVPKTEPKACYYTGDHYASFQPIEN